MVIMVATAAISEGFMPAIYQVRRVSRVFMALSFLIARAQVLFVQFANPQICERLPDEVKLVDGIEMQECREHAQQFFKLSGHSIGRAETCQRSHIESIRAGGRCKKPLK